MIRASLAVRERKEPEAWSTFNTRSLLGGVLLGQERYADAEPSLLAGYRGMKERAAKQPEGCTVISSRSNTTKPTARVRMRLNAPRCRSGPAAPSSPSSTRTSSSVASRRKVTMS